MDILKISFRERMEAWLGRPALHYFDLEEKILGPISTEQLPASYLFWETLGFRIPILERLFMKTFTGQPALRWDSEIFKKLISIEINSFPKEIFSRLCPYPEAWGQMRRIHSILENKKILIIGSETYWVELMCFLSGASEVTTVEYRPITWSDMPPQGMTTLLWNDFVKELDQHREKYDTVLSYSSIEHSGLGRYGDPLMAQGDLFTLMLMSMCLRQGGTCAVAVPVGQDLCHFNAHRIYGPVRIRAMEYASGLEFKGIAGPETTYLEGETFGALRDGWTLDGLFQLPLGEYRQPLLCFSSR